MIEVKQRQEIIYPKRVVKKGGKVFQEENLFKEKNLALTPAFQEEINVLLKKDGEENPYLILDFGREIQGGLRLTFSSVYPNYLNMRFLFGESVSECVYPLGEKGASNPHATKDTALKIANMSVREFTRQGFRFVRIELKEMGEIWIKGAVALKITEDLDPVGYIKTDDPLVNQIIDTAVYTCFLCAQEGVVYDGIKRDRLLWSGDLNSEILTLSYYYGNIPNIKNSLEMLRDESRKDRFINGIPSYSVWWLLNVADYYLLSGDKGFVVESLPLLREILTDLDKSVLEGNIDFSRTGKPFDMEFFLDWQSFEKPDAKIGVAGLILYALQKLKKANIDGVDIKIVNNISSRLLKLLDENSTLKQVVAFQVLTGNVSERNKKALEEGGAKGFSTFMAYFILKALDLAKSQNTLEYIKEYYGGMLSRGATTFWEDFDLSWLKGSGRIDEQTPEGLLDLHGDFGAYCYEGLKHSLCHGWSSGVVGFFVENVLGLEVLESGFKKVRVKPNLYGLEKIEGSIPTPNGNIEIRVEMGKKTSVKAPNGVEIVE